jgi:hypothetical protein
MGVFSKLPRTPSCPALRGALDDDVKPGKRAIVGSIPWVSETRPGLCCIF